jgi:hypothetical protein
MRSSAFVRSSSCLSACSISISAWKSAMNANKPSAAASRRYSFFIIFWYVVAFVPST